MDEDELRMISDLGFIEIGSHTWDHADLEVADETEIARQLKISKEALEEILLKPVLTLAYPFCRYSEACPPAAERAGYLCAFTCSGRGSWQPYELSPGDDGSRTIPPRLGAQVTRRSSIGVAGSPPARASAPHEALRVN